MQMILKVHYVFLNCFKSPPISASKIRAVAKHLTFSIIKIKGLFTPIMLS